MRKRFPEEIAKFWAKEWLAGIPAKAVALKFLSENRERYSSQLEKGEHRAVSTVLPLLYYWHKIYNLDMTKRKGSKTARPLPKIDITKLDDRDKELFNKAINELLGPKGVSHDDIVAAIAKLKEDAKNKSNFSSSFGVSRKIFYRRGKDGIQWKPQDWIVALVTKTFEMSRRVYGYVKIFHTLLRHCPGLKLNDVLKNLWNVAFSLCGVSHNQAKPFGEEIHRAQPAWPA